MAGLDPIVRVPLRVVTLLASLARAQREHPRYVGVAGEAGRRGSISEDVSAEEIGDEGDDRGPARVVLEGAYVTAAADDCEELGRTRGRIDALARQQWVHLVGVAVEYEDGRCRGREPTSGEPCHRTRENHSGCNAGIGAARVGGEARRGDTTVGVSDDAEFPVEHDWAERCGTRRRVEEPIGDETEVAGLLHDVT